MDIQPLILLIVNLFNTVLAVFYNRNRKKVVGEVKEAVFAELRPWMEKVETSIENHDREREHISDKLDLVLTLLPKNQPFTVYKNGKSDQKGKSANP